MIEEKRESVAWMAREMLALGLTDGTSGNVSVMERETGLVAITPSGIAYQGMTADQIPVINMDGEKILGEFKPSSEYRMHLAAFKARADITVVLHTHSRFAIALSCVLDTLPAITIDMAAYCGAEAPVLPYRLPGSDAIAEVAATYVKQGFRAMLLANHGTLLVSSDEKLVLEAAQVLELAAMAYIRASIVGKPRPIPKPEVEKLLDMVYGGGGV
jgi:L-fuculose-phosphate aldolase